jgi:hypothetical protein
MRNVRLVLTIVFAAIALSTAACTSPTAPAPTNDDIIGSGV